MRKLVVIALSLLAAMAAGEAATFDDLAARAAAARRNDQIPEAVALYRQALDLNAAWPEGWWFAGTLSYSQYKYAASEEALARFVELDGARPLAWALLGLCEFETGKYDLALEHLRKSLTPGNNLPPEVEVGVRFHHGLLLTRARLFDQGRRELERFAESAAQEPLVLAGIGLNALHEPLLPTEAPAERRDLVALAGKATRFRMLGDTAQAEEAFQELLANYPAAPGVHYLFGSYLISWRPAEARSEFKRELDLNPTNADARASMALLLVRANDVSGAMTYAKEAVSERPSDSLAQYAYGETLVSSGALISAIGRLETAERLDPAALEYHLALAGAYSRAGRYEDSRKERRMSIDIATGVHAAD